MQRKFFRQTSIISTVIFVKMYTGLKRSLSWTLSCDVKFSQSSFELDHSTMATCFLFTQVAIPDVSLEEMDTVYSWPKTKRLSRLLSIEESSSVMVWGWICSLCSYVLIQHGLMHLLYLQTDNTLTAVHWRWYTDNAQLIQTAWQKDYFYYLYLNCCRVYKCRLRLNVARGT